MFSNSERFPFLCEERRQADQFKPAAGLSGRLQRPYSLEQIVLHCHGRDFGGGDQVEELVISRAVLRVLEDRLQRMLRFVSGESLVLAIEVWGNGNPSRYRSQRDNRTLRQRELRGY